ncbi:ABC transporter permease [bacterium]|nr:ABC transporter permease [bacterium]
MIKLIIRKELKEVIGSPKFIASFVVSSILILLTFYIGAQNHHRNVSRYEAVMTANLRKMEGLTDWMRVNNHRIFLPPQPLEALVNGVSNDIGRTVQMHGQGELTARSSRFNDDPVFAVFRFLDLDFVFQIVLSLFAILFAYDAINGEKERGTLRLTFASDVPRATYILGKWLGSFLAVGIPLLIPILLGGICLPIFGVVLSGVEWIRLGLIVLAGLLYFGVFLSLALLFSVSTHRPSNAFLGLLVSWILLVMIIPRTAVLLAGRAVDVPSIDDHNFQKAQFRSQLWDEDREKMRNFSTGDATDSQGVMGKFNEFMSELSRDRQEKMDELAARLNGERRLKQNSQQAVAFAMARISPSAVFSLAASRLSDTSLDQKAHFLDEAAGYQKTYAEFKKEKTGMNMGSGMVMMFFSGDEEEKKPIDVNELPKFDYHPTQLGDAVSSALFDMGLLVIFNLLFFAGTFVKFMRYDVR